MVLLTPSQVSVLLSSAIVISCTAALFLSGYVIQQRTLNQLRVAIRSDPRPSPKTSYVVPEHLKGLASGGGENNNAPVYGLTGRLSQQQQVMVEVAATPPQQQQQQQQQHHETPKKQLAGQKQPGWTSDLWHKMVSGPEKEEKEGLSREELENMDERERNIQGWRVKDQKHPDPDAANQKPISRAERRRLIKEEIQRLSQGEQPVHYQRRLW